MYLGTIDVTCRLALLADITGSGGLGDGGCARCRCTLQAAEPWCCRSSLLKLL